MGTAHLTPMVKRPGREANHSFQFRTEIRTFGAKPPRLNTPSWPEEEKTAIKIGYFHFFFSLF